MWQESESACGEGHQLSPASSLGSRAGGTAAADAVLVSAVLTGAPTSWLWTFPAVTDLDASVHARRASREKSDDDAQWSRRAARWRGPVRRLCAIWQELSRIVRAFEKRWHTQDSEECQHFNRACGSRYHDR